MKRLEFIPPEKSSGSSQKLFLGGALVIPFLLFTLLTGAAEAQETAAPKFEILQLNDTVQEKRGKIEEIRDRIETYKLQISNLQKQSTTLANEIALLENRLVKTELDIEALELEIEAANLEIEALDREIVEKQLKIEQERKMLADILREIRKYDQRSSIAIILGANTFSDFYSHLHFLEDVQSRLQGTLNNVRLAKEAQEKTRKIREEHRLALGTLKEDLERKQILLEDEQAIKEFLLSSTQSSEVRFQELLRELREELQFVDAQLGKLQTELSERLKSFDVDFGGGTLFSWPLSARTLITTFFHDPSYPYRHLFEHSGLDLRASVGSSVLATAPGIVAVARTGKLYGNYVAVVHANGFSTLYAHLSQIMVAPDQFVKRGDAIALSGGARGAPGAGLSTGPHLHFEIRSNGIPVNPLDYLISF